LSEGEIVMDDSEDAASDAVTPHPSSSSCGSNSNSNSDDSSIEPGMYAPETP
jgi:hypothetical protein